MKNRFTLSWLNLLVLLVAASLILSACGPGSGVATGSDGTIVWLDQPMTNYSIPLAPFTLIAHAGHPGGGITSVVFLVNSVSVGAVAMDTGLEFLRAETVWNPSGPGFYIIQAQAITSGGVAYTRNAAICVRSGITAPQFGFDGPCASTPSVPLALALNLRSNPVYRGDCPGNALDIEAQLTGDTSAIATLQGSWSFNNPDGSTPPLVNGESWPAMTRQSDTSYTYTRDFTNAAMDFGLGSGTYLLYATVRALDASGNVLATQNIGPVDWLDCPATPTPTTTFTPAPADTTPPSITGISLNPADTAYYISGCGANVVSVQADVSDPSGVASVTLVYQYSAGSSMSIAMTSGGGSTYSATINVGSEAYGILSGVDGTLTITIQATDQWGNATSINAGMVVVMFCPG